MGDFQFDVFVASTTPAVAAEPSCPICGGPVRPRYRLPDLSRRLALGAVATVSWCGGCDAGFLFPRPGPEANALLYDDYFRRRSPGAAPPGRRRPTLLDRLRVHVAYRLDRGAGSLLDVVRGQIGRGDADLCEIGCGDGDVLATFARAGFRTVGVEPFAAAIRQARGKGLEVLAGTAEHLPAGLPHAAFDVVMLTQVLEHCHDPAPAVGNALSLLRPGGLLFIDVPNCGSFQFRDRGMGWFHADPGRHVNYFTPGALRVLLGRAGAEEVGNYYAQYQDHFLDERIEIERAAREGARRGGGAGELAGLPPVSGLRLMGTLVRTCGLRPDRKYGIVGVIARRGEAARS
jgi:SAM-dependent methyltransferase